MHARRESITVTTDAAGAATEYFPVMTGAILSIHYTKGDFATGVDFAITTETLAQGVWTESNVDASAARAPRQATHSVAGVAALYAAAGTAVNDFVYLANERVKVVISSGGNTKTGTFDLIVGG